MWTFFYRIILILFSMTPGCFAAQAIAPSKNKPVVVFAHGVYDTAKNFKHSVVQKVFPDFSLYGKNGPEYSEGWQDNDKICLGQEADINQVIAACEEALQKNQSPNIIGFGFSKGSATWLNTLGFLSTSQDPKHKEILACIKAVVVIAPFADFFEVEGLTGLLGSFGPLAQRFALSDWFGLGKKAIARILKSFFPGYDPYGLHPIISIDSIVPDIPVFIAHSTGDELIPIKHSRMIYLGLHKKLERREFKNIYLFEFDGGRHSRSMHACPLWHEPMYDFLAKYGLMESLRGPIDDLDLQYMQPAVSETQCKMLKRSTIPSLSYGFLFALGLEATKGFDHLFSKSSTGSYKTSFKKSLGYGLLFAGAIELLYQFRKA